MWFTLWQAPWTLNCLCLKSWSGLMTRGKFFVFFYFLPALVYKIWSNSTASLNQAVASNHNITITNPSLRKIMADGMKVILYHQEKSIQCRSQASPSFSSATPKSSSCPWSGLRRRVSTSSASPINPYPASGWRVDLICIFALGDDNSPMSILGVGETKDTINNTFLICLVDFEAWTWESSPLEWCKTANKHQ